MKCTNCNRDIENDSVFCEYCGVNVMQTYLMSDLISPQHLHTVLLFI